MSSMSEDALFKAILKNKPLQGAQVEQKAQAVKKEIKDAPKAPASSEDMMYKVLLKNRPPQPEVKESVPVPQVNAVQTIDHESKVVETPPPVMSLHADAVEESIKNLTASVNMMHGLMKTVIVPVLVLILIVGIGVFVKLS